jgi:hypothetical protein
LEKQDGKISKGAAKKAAKLDKKAALKAGASAPASSSSAAAAAPSNELCLWAESETDALKVLASAAIHSAAAVQPAASNAAVGLSFGSTCTLSNGSAVVFGASAACRYFAYAASATTDAQGTVAVDSAIEWADSCSSGADLLTGLEARLSSSGGSYIAGVS